jgi:hypothetical protein
MIAEIIILVIVLVVFAFGLGAISFILLVWLSDKEDLQDTDYVFPYYTDDYSNDLPYFNLGMFSKKKKNEDEKGNAHRDDEEDCLIQNDPML